MNKSLRRNSTQRFSFPGRFYKSRIDKCSKGFTLVELLVVLASIALLAVTLIPALASAKPNSLAFQCMNNLRQWGAAMRTMGSDNNDMMARDGTDNSGSYAVFTGATTGPGSPNDPYAWLQRGSLCVGGNSRCTYYYRLPGANYSKKYPFPGNGKGKIWHCPAAKTASGDVFLINGEYGFFSYVMNMDLKLNSTIANGVIGNSAGLSEHAQIWRDSQSFGCGFVYGCRFQPDFGDFHPQPKSERRHALLSLVCLPQAPQQWRHDCLH